GNLNLLSARGTLGFRLTALEPQNGTQNLASAYSYQITRGTGVFVGARGGGGSVTLALIQGPRSQFGFPRILQRFSLSLKSDVLVSPDRSNARNSGPPSTLGSTKTRRDEVARCVDDDPDGSRSDRPTYRSSSGSPGVTPRPGIRSGEP